MKFVVAFLSVWKVRQSHFKHCEGAVQFVQACLRVGSVPQSHLNYREDPEMLVRICLSIGMVGQSHFRPCEARAILFECLEGRTKHMEKFEDIHYN